MTETSSARKRWITAGLSLGLFVLTFFVFDRLLLFGLRAGAARYYASLKADKLRSRHTAIYGQGDGDLLIFGSSRARYAFGQASYASYLVNGDTTDWAFGVHGIPAYTIELPPQTDQGGGFFNAESEILPIFNENLEAALYLIEDCITVYAPPAAEGRRPDRSPGRPSCGKPVEK